MLNEILSALKAHKMDSVECGGINVGINDGINERNILAIIAELPNVTVRDMADALGLSLRQCERLIKRTGSNKSGLWEIVR